MQIRLFFLFACLFAAPLLRANPDAPNGSATNILSKMEESCNLPAPTNFNLDAWGPDWVHLEWDLTNPLYQHRINIYSCVDTTLLIKTFIVNAGVTETTIFFTNPPLDIYSYEIKAICTSGDSPNSAWIKCFGGTGVGIIHDLIVSGFTHENGEATCTIDFGNDRCYFNNSEISTFKIWQTTNNYNRRIFGMERMYSPNNNTPHYQMIVKPPHTPEDLYQFYLNGLQAPPDRYGGSRYEIKDKGRLVAALVVEIDPWSGESYLKKVVIATDYEIIRISDFEPGDPPTGERDEQATTLTHPATASPNPFTDQLDVFPSNTAAESITLQLFNLSGQKVLDQQFTGGQEQYSLSTEGLATGFYFLRIEADGEVQTLKVIKSE